MKYTEQLETRLAELFAKAPSLPRSARSWIGVNAWWIILIFAIIDAFGVLGNIRALTAITTRNSLSNIYMSGGSGPSTALAVTSLVVSAVVTILYFAAIQPLKDRQKLGWNLVLYAMVIGFVYSIVSAVLSLVVYGGPFVVVGIVVGLVVSLLFASVWLYFLFQIRDEFASRAGRAAEGKVVTKKAVIKKSPATSLAKKPAKNTKK